MTSVSYAELFLRHLKLSFTIDNCRFLMLLSPEGCEGERGVEAKSLTRDIRRNRYSEVNITSFDYIPVTSVMRSYNSE